MKNGLCNYSSNFFSWANPFFFVSQPLKTFFLGGLRAQQHHQQKPLIHSWGRSSKYQITVCGRNPANRQPFSHLISTTVCCRRTLHPPHYWIHPWNKKQSSYLVDIYEVHDWTSHTDRIQALRFYFTCAYSTTTVRAVRWVFGNVHLTMWWSASQIKYKYFVRSRARELHLLNNTLKYYWLKYCRVRTVVVVDYYHRMPGAVVN